MSTEETNHSTLSARLQLFLLHSCFVVVRAWSPPLCVFVCGVALVSKIHLAPNTRKWFSQRPVLHRRQPQHPHNLSDCDSGTPTPPMATVPHGTGTDIQTYCNSWKTAVNLDTKSNRGKQQWTAMSSWLRHRGVAQANDIREGSRRHDGVRLHTSEVERCEATRQRGTQSPVPQHEASRETEHVWGGTHQQRGTQLRQGVQCRLCRRRVTQSRFGRGTTICRGRRGRAAPS